MALAGQRPGGLRVVLDLFLLLSLYQGKESMETYNNSMLLKKTFACWFSEENAAKSHSVLLSFDMKTFRARLRIAGNKVAHYPSNCFKIIIVQCEVELCRK